MAIYKTEQEVNGEQIIIHIEMDDISESDDGLEGISSRLLETTRDVFGDGMKLARNCAVRVVEEVQEMTTDICPDEFEIQLAVKLDSQGSLRPKHKWNDEDEIAF